MRDRDADTLRVVSRIRRDIEKARDGSLSYDITVTVRQGNPLLYRRLEIIDIKALDKAE